MTEDERIDKLLRWANEASQQCAEDGQAKHAALFAMLAREIRDQQKMLILMGPYWRTAMENYKEASHD